MNLLNGFPDNLERPDQTISLVDDEHVEIKNAYGSKSSRPLA